MRFNGVQGVRCTAPYSLCNWFNKAQLKNKLMIHDTGSPQQGWSVCPALGCRGWRKGLDQPARSIDAQPGGWPPS